MNTTLINKISEAQIVSFDIFDTLVERYVEKPDDVFALVERKWNQNNVSNTISNFKNNRIKAEKKCRKRTKSEEITISDIYEELSKEYPDINVETLKQEEINIERNVCHRKSLGYEAYNYCVNSNKRIIITSDMYLPIDVINDILSKCGYAGHEEIFLSSDLNRRKKTGSIFEYIIALMDVPPSKILHIGDNAESDVNMARRHGLSAFQIETENNRYHFWSTDRCKGNSALVNGFLSKKVVEDEYYCAGYDILGPLLFGFTEWLHEFVKKNNPDKVIFLARDGDIIKKYYEQRYGVDDKLLVYAYASRRGLIVPTLWKNPTLDNIQNSIHFHDHMKVVDVLERIGIDYTEYESILQKHALSLETRVDGVNLEKDVLFKELFEDIKEDIFQNSKNEYSYAIEYWKSFVKDAQKIYVVDIGWNGNMQVALHKLFNDIGDFSIEGFYLGVNPNSKKKEVMHGFMFDKKYNEDLHNYLEIYMPLFETLFMSEEGSLQKYVDTEDKYRLYNYEYASLNGRIVNEVNALKLIRQGSLDFCMDFEQYYSEMDLKFQISDAIANMFNFGLEPTPFAAKLFGDFRFFNSSIQYLAYSQKGHFSIREFLESNWKIGYLQRYIGCNLSYKKLIIFLKNAKRFLKR